MATGPNDAPLIAIVGETASGKTALALHLASLFDGEIIAADSRTVYRGMDIGTAKPTLQEQKLVRHHLIDVVNPNTTFSAADFQRLAKEAIADVHRRKKLPIVVGGTGLYVDALLYNFTFRPRADPAQRVELERLDVAALQEIIIGRGLPMPRNNQNPRHLMRTIETNGVATTRYALPPHTLIIGKKIEREILRQQLLDRVDSMVDAGFVDEVVHVAEQYGWSAPGLQAPGYRAFHDYIEGIDSLQQAKDKFIHNDWQLAKRQRTWFKRNPDIKWIYKTEEAVDLVTTFLNK
jgi:tRNA dimethylallyltransferase